MVDHTLSHKQLGRHELQPILHHIVEDVEQRILRKLALVEFVDLELRSLEAFGDDQFEWMWAVLIFGERRNQ